MNTKTRKTGARLGALLLSLCLLVGLLPVTAFAAEPTVTPGDAYRTTRTEAVVEFTSDTAGQYYYTAILPSDFPESGELEIDTTGEGTPCAAGQKVSATVDGLTTEPCLLFLVVKGEDGTESEVMRINIPEWDWWTLDEHGLLTLESDKGLTYWNDWLNSQDLYFQFYYKQSVTGVNIWKDVTNVKGSSFPASEYPNLAAYTVEDGNAEYCVEDGVLYNASKTWLVAYPGGKTDTDFTVPDTVTSISSKAFYGNTKLKNITANKVGIVSQAFAGSAIETFSANEIVRIADWAFYNCKKLTTVTVNGGESFYIDMYAFENCTSLTSFPFDMISDSGFRVFRGCSSLTEIQVPNRVNDSMFADCTSLTKITVPDTVTLIGNYAFEGCTSLISVTFEGATPPMIFSSAFKPTQPAFRIHVPEGSEDAYIEELGETFAPYILDNIQQYPLYVNGERIRSDNLTVACGDGTAAFDPATNTLTLKNAAITKYGGEYGYRGAINSGFENLTIVLVGDNTINAEGDSINTDMGCNLVITGDGTLTTNSHLDLGRGPGYGGNNDTGDLTIDGATVNVGTYLFVHHNITFKNGAKVNVAGTITANHQSTVTLEGAATSVTANALSMGNGSNSDQTECKFVLNDGNLTLRDGVNYYQDPKYAIYFDPKEEGKIEINGGTFQTQSDCKVTNAPKENITTSSDVEIKLGSWDNGKLLISEHTGVFVPESAATCTQNGTKSHYKCNDCGNLFEDEDCTVLIKDPSVLIIPATGHMPGSEWYTTDTEHYQICDICKEEVNKAAHTSTGANAATCQHKAVCDVCSAEYGEPADHSPASGWSNDETGHWHACQTSGCTEKLDFAAHTPDHEGHATEEYAIKCTECGYVIEAQLGHTHVFDREVATDAYKATDATCTAKATYYKSCACGEKGTETFEYGDLADHVSTGDNTATCQHKAVCDICGAEYGEPADHTWTPATCATPKTCSVCGATVGAALGHTGGLGWKSDEDNHWHVCTGCGVVIENSKAAHDFKWVIDKAATATESGSKHEECTICGYRKAPVEISVTGTPAEPGKPDNTQSPQTGDSSNAVLWIALLFASGVGLFGAVVYSRKKRYSK